jgi:hypothetical protein
MGGQNLQNTLPKQIMSQASIWALDLYSKLHSLLRSSLEVAEDHDRDYCVTNFQNHQFLSYRHVIYIKKVLISYWLQIILVRKRWFWTVFVKNRHLLKAKKILAFIFFLEKSINHKKWPQESRKTPHPPSLNRVKQTRFCNQKNKWQKCNVMGLNGFYCHVQIWINNFGAPN